MVKKKDLLMLCFLRRDARIKLTELSRATRIPVSTLFDRLRFLESAGIIRKHAALIRFEDFGFSARALVLLSAKKSSRERLLEVLSKSREANSLFRVNNGWQFLAEVVCPGIREVEEFLQGLEGKAEVSGKRVFYVVEELKREAFLSNPESVLVAPGGGK
jgi:Lrp/AsnC family leucine-responsive transcriptional regulator